MKQCLIIAGGDFDRKFASSYISMKYHNAGPDCLIAADRGLQAVQELGLIPDIMLGDYDSVDKACLDMYADNPDIRNLQYPPEKNYTDSQLAVVAALEAGVTDICMMGVTGTRMDHVQANIGLLKCCIDVGVQAELVDAHNRIRMVKHSLLIQREEQFGTYVSLVPYSDCVDGITISGFRYPLENAVFSKSAYKNPLDDMGPSRGISNEIIADKAEITIQSGYLLVMESRD
jgi:thiamine pyrophosphokinase